jgi:hypothetical protein
VPVLKDELAELIGDIVRRGGKNYESCLNDLEVARDSGAEGYLLVMRK